MPAHPLGGELNRRQRVLDLVRQPPRDVAPGRDPLRPHQRRHVVEHQHRAFVRARLALQRRRRGRQVDLAPLARERDFLRRPASPTRRDRAHERRERLQILARRAPASTGAPTMPRSTSSRRSAAALIVLTRPSGPIEITPVAIRSRTVSM